MNKRDLLLHILHNFKQENIGFETTILQIDRVYANLLGFLVPKDVDEVISEMTKEEVEEN